MTDRRSKAEAFEALAMPLFASLYNLAHWLTQNWDEAEDLLQETYLKALKGFAAFEQGTNFRAWMYRILRNTFLTSRAGLSVKMTEPFDTDGNVTAAPHTPESMLLVRSDQQVILLCDLEEMSYREMAQTLGVPIGTVMSRPSRARKSMRELIAAKARGASK